MKINRKLSKRIDLIWRKIGGVILTAFLSVLIIECIGTITFFTTVFILMIIYALISLIVLGYFKIIKLMKKFKKKK